MSSIARERAYPLQVGDLSTIGLGRIASDLMDLRGRVKRRARPAERPEVDREALRLLDRLLSIVESEADRRDRATRGEL